MTECAIARVVGDRAGAPHRLCRGQCPCSGRQFRPSPAQTTVCNRAHGAQQQDHTHEGMNHAPRLPWPLRGPVPRLRHLSVRSIVRAHSCSPALQRLTRGSRLPHRFRDCLHTTTCSPTLLWHFWHCRPITPNPDSYSQQLTPLRGKISHVLFSRILTSLRLRASDSLPPAS